MLHGFRISIVTTGPALSLSIFLYLFVLEILPSYWLPQNFDTVLWVLYRLVSYHNTRIHKEFINFALHQKNAY